MMKQLVILTLLILCCSTIFGQTDEKGIVLGVERTTADAFSKHNVTYLMSVFADDVQIISADGRIVTKQQMLEAVQRVTSVTVSDMNVRIESNVAIVTGIVKENGKDDNGGVYSNKMRFTDVLLRTKGQWKIITSQATSLSE